MVAVVITYPQLVSGNMEQVEKIDADKALQEMSMPAASEEAASAPEAGASEPESAASGAEGEEKTESSDDDPMKALQDAMEKDAKAKK
jgi:hypothetical protein